MRRLSLFVLVFLQLGFTHSASANALDLNYIEPQFKRLRYQEDWSILRAKSSETSLYEDIKYLPLTDDANTHPLVWASFGGQARVRAEYWRDFNFSKNADDEFLLTRALLHAALHIGTVRVFIEGKTAQATKRDLPGGRRHIDMDTLALEQGFVDWQYQWSDVSSVILRVGRQALSLGRQRFLSSLPWVNTQRTWEGVSLLGKMPAYQTQAFALQLVNVDKTANNRANKQTEFFGLYVTHQTFERLIAGWDAYWFFLDQDKQRFNGTVGNELRHTFGTRFWGSSASAPVDYETEVALQVGSIGNNNITSVMLSAELGYHFYDVWAIPRLFIGLDYATGDDTPGGDVETFNQLFPLSHAFLGFMDFIGRQNIIDLSAGVRLKPTDKVVAKISVHNFWREDAEDALYTPIGTVFRPPTVNKRFVGTEADLTVSYQYNKHLKLLLGYSHFFTGSFIKQTGEHADADFAYVAAEIFF